MRSSEYKLTSNLATNKVGVSHKRLQLANDLAGTSRVDIFIVVAGEERAAILSPKVLLDLLNGRSNARVLDAEACNNVQPGNNGPETILFANVVATSAEALLTTYGQLLCIKESAEELPAGGNLVAVKLLGLGNEVNSARGRH